MNIKTSELIGPALDWTVITANGQNADYWLEMYLSEGRRVFCSRPSMQWLEGGPIIERERIETYWHSALDMWAGKHDGNTRYGPTPLIAAMRCFVASKFGDEVEVPEELCK